VAAEIVAGNPVAAADGLTVEILMGDVEVDPENASHVLGDLNWSRNNKGIVVLPESFEPHRRWDNMWLYATQLLSPSSRTLTASQGCL